MGRDDETRKSTRGLENELALLIFHMRMNRMTQRERAIYFNSLVGKYNHVTGKMK